MDNFEPFKNGKAITTSDTVAQTPTTAAIWVGGAGNLTVRLVGDTADVVLNGALAGTVYYLRATHIRATGTTATNLVALS